MRPALIVLFCTFPFSANADWIEYKTLENGDVYFYDPSQVVMDGNALRVLNRIRYRTSVMGAKSFESEIKLDCAGRTHALMSSTFFNDGNWQTPAMASNTREQPAKEIEDGSVADALATILCK